MSKSNLQHLCIRLGLIEKGSNLNDDELRQMLSCPKSLKRRGPILDDIQMVCPKLYPHGLTVLCPNEDGKHVVKMRRVGLSNSVMSEGTRKENFEFLNGLMMSLMTTLGHRLGALSLNQNEIDR